MNINCTQHFIRVIVHSALLHLNSKCRSGIPSYSYLVRRSRSLSSKKLPLPERALVNQQVNCTTIGGHESGLVQFQNWCFHKVHQFCCSFHFAPLPAQNCKKGNIFVRGELETGRGTFSKLWVINELTMKCKISQTAEPAFSIHLFAHRSEVAMLLADSPWN